MTCLVRLLNNQLAFGFSDGSIWDLDKEIEIKFKSEEEEGHNATVTCLVELVNKQQLASCSRDGTIHI